MTLQTQVSENERGVIRLYEIALPHDEARAITASDIQQAFGVDHLDSDFVETFHVRDLQELGLRGYMETGLGIASCDIDPFAERIVDVDGWVALVVSQAFGGRETRLAPKHPLRPIGAFVEEGASTPLTRLQAETAKPSPPPDASEENPKGKKPRSDAAMSGMVATIVLIVLALLVFAMIWVGG
ncbi:hypothetical protein [Nereida sp. MMG025]|uniref:hypothetical protein n=1 Tax=Nereida sp. MMG025 TaxID=2909981 RepID=UPI001F3327A6|nr:hypothetical protein [Nereida sp. MMG025]MCF6444386.1 hypothetical protein [Nereida sp. MMG025]